MKRFRLPRMAGAAVAAAVLAACAGNPVPQESEATAAAAPEPRHDCVVTTGSNICRKPDTGNMHTVTSVSGDDVRRSGGMIRPPAQGRVGD